VSERGNDDGSAAVARRLRFPLVCFDLDGTLVDDTVYIWSTLHEHFRTDAARRARAREDFYAGRISYTSWFQNYLELLDEAGARRATMVALIATLPVMPGAREVLAELRRQGRKVAVISGSIDLVVTTLFPDQVFDGMFINRLRFDAAGRLAGGEPTPYDLEQKAAGLKELARREGLSESQVAFVGDNVNDVDVARAAGLAIAFNCKSEELARVADVVVEDHDLRAVLPHLE
jgi:phosphoserine phosphatase